jgi:hypothetical protein
VRDGDGRGHRDGAAAGAAMLVGYVRIFFGIFWSFGERFCVNLER